MAIMQQGLCQLLVVVVWTGGILRATVQVVFTMDFIDHFMYDFFSLLELACRLVAAGRV